MEALLRKAPDGVGREVVVPVAGPPPAGGVEVQDCRPLPTPECGRFEEKIAGRPGREVLGWGGCARAGGEEGDAGQAVAEAELRERAFVSDWL
ncbi:MAG: hypothetical protein IPL39_03685 [Opitutaceae bacterium]|nr:hypothetical protein [Opitutaceae bacterium]